MTYLVDSDPNVRGSGTSGFGTSAYPLQVDFYTSDGNGEGQVYLGAATYTEDDYNGVGTGGCNSGPCPDEETEPPPAGVTLTASDNVVATATDADGNTSEFSGQSAQLPLELASFDATQTGAETVTLTWTTATETNNAGFRIQRLVKPSRREGSTTSLESPTTDWTTIRRVDGTRPRFRLR